MNIVFKSSACTGHLETKDDRAFENDAGGACAYWSEKVKYLI